MADTSNFSRKLINLRVIDLRNQLEIRGLDKTGVKQTLIDRLKMALTEEGNDPDTYDFHDISRTKKFISKVSDVDDEDGQNNESVDNMDSGNENTSFTDNGMDGLDNDDYTKTINIDQVSNMETEQAVVDKTKLELSINDPMLIHAENQHEDFNSDFATNGGFKYESTDYQSAILDQHQQRSMQQLIEPITHVVSVDDDELQLSFNEVEDTNNDKDLSKEDEHLLLSICDDGMLLPGEELSGGDGEASNKNEDSVINSSSMTETLPPVAASADEANQHDDQEATILEDGISTSVSAVQSFPVIQVLKADSIVAKNAVETKPLNSSRNLWISGLSSSTRAADLKTLFSKYGKVTGAKVVTNAKSPGAKCYGFVTMTTTEEASKCIQYLHRTELHGRMISVERAKADPAPPITDKLATAVGGVAQQAPSVIAVAAGTIAVTEKTVATPNNSSSSAKSSKVLVKKKPITDKETAPSEKKINTKPTDKYSKLDSKERKRSRSPKKQQLTLDKIRMERDRERERQRERVRRMEERRLAERRHDMAIERQRNYQREIARKQREESARLEREKEQLRLEKQKLELEKLAAEREKIALERERQRQEREKLEREREERRMEMQRKTMKRPAELDSYWSNPKRASQTVGPKTTSPPVFRKGGREVDHRSEREISRNLSARLGSQRSRRSKEKSPRKIARPITPTRSVRIESRDNNDYLAFNQGTSWHAPQSSHTSSPRSRNYDSQSKVYTALPLGMTNVGSNHMPSWSVPPGRSSAMDNSSFLSSAANILMGVGLTSGRHQASSRGESFKAPPSRRY